MVKCPKCGEEETEAFIPHGMEKLWEKEITRYKHYPYGDD